MGLSLAFFQKFLAQPPSHRLVVKFQTKIGYQYIPYINAQGYSPRFPECKILVLNQPRIEQIHKRVMRDIKRERNISQKFTYPRRCFIGRVSRRTQYNENRKYHDYTKCLKKTIHTYRFDPFYIRNTKQNQQYERAYPECPSHFHRFEITRQQQSQRKREKHSQQSTHKIHRIERPAYPYHAIPRYIEDSETSQTDSQ